MSKIKIKSLFSILTAKLILFLSKRIFKGGSSFPGKVALKFDSNILSVVAKNYKVILVTGTNGKTTTTSMIYNIIKKSGNRVITNSTGANMLPGITATFIDNYKIFGKKKPAYAVIEVDEANLKFITKYISPEIITITNLFRDQLDRYGEVYTTLAKIMEGLENVSGAKLVLNGDESLLGDLNTNNDLCYYGFNVSPDESKLVDINADAKFCKKCKHPYNYELITFSHLGSYICPNCQYQRPQLKYAVNAITEMTPYYSKVIINETEIIINQPGVYNIYNGLCAFSICKEIGIEDNIIFESLRNQASHFGRQEALSIEGKEVKIILVKNPAGYNQAIDTVSLDERAVSVAFLLNDNYADGRDISWIWDVNFEKMTSLEIQQVLIGGIRNYDMAIRLKIAGFNTEAFKISEDFDSLLGNIKNCPSDFVYILATYTAMIDFRKYLHGKGYIKKLW
ncbi:MAG: Mur ligase family protein [Clostridiales bacterium]|nr:Mur ligase family protein [Clostridiales bacterium]